MQGTVRAKVASLSPSSQIFCAVVAGLYLLSHFKVVYRFLAVTPGSVIPPEFRIWTLVTGSLVEHSILHLVLNVGVILLSATVFEPLWGNLEFLKFIGIVSFFSCLGTAMTYLFAYIFAQHLSFLFFQFSGLAGVVAALCVAFKQAFPQRRIRFPGGISLDSRFGPGLLLCAHALLYAVRLQPGAQIVLALHGTLAGWTYLRFYQWREGTQGDSSDSMAFVDFFPAPLQPIMQLVSNRIFQLAVLMRLCRKEPLQYDLGGPSSIRISLPGVRPADAERRRQIALRDLDSRLAVGGGGDGNEPAAGVGAAVQKAASRTPSAGSASASASASAATSPRAARHAAPPSSASPAADDDDDDDETTV